MAKKNAIRFLNKNILFDSNKCKMYKQPVKSATRCIQHSSTTLSGTCPKYENKHFDSDIWPRHTTRNNHCAVYKYKISENCRHKKMIEFQKVFVTVGTTQFDDLITSILSESSLQQLKALKCKHLLIQYGTGRDVDAAAIESAVRCFGITVECYRLKNNISEDITSSNLVISHAGAGSCIEVLNAKKPLIVVVNENLMDNHQTELAAQLHADGYLLYCTPATLATTLKQFIGGVDLQTYEPGNMNKLVAHLDNLMGY